MSRCSTLHRRGNRRAARSPGAAGLAVMRRLLVAESALIRSRAHLLLVAEPLQVLGRGLDPWRSRRGGPLVWGFGGHEAIVSGLARLVQRSRLCRSGDMN